MEEHPSGRRAWLETLIVSIVLTACGTREKEDTSSALRAAAGGGSLVGVQSTTAPPANSPGMAASGSARTQQAPSNPEGTANPVALSSSGTGSGGTGGAPGAGEPGDTEQPRDDSLPGAGGDTSSSACSGGASLAPSETTRTLRVGGVERSYILHVPPGYTGSSAVPLVLDFHGLGGNGAGQKALSGLAALSDQNDFVIAWPDGIDNAWNIGPCCTRSRDVDDLGFAKAIVAEVQSLGCIDAKRVYTTGFSMGGGMSHFLACNAADIFAAATPSAFDLLETSQMPCQPVRPISVLAFRGTADPLVTFAGGISTPPNGCCPPITFLGALGSFKQWGSIDGCTGNPTSTGNTMTFNQCKDGVQAGLVTIQGGGHAPGPATAAWDFLKTKSLP
jgi:polyhydroxybutyrate depolymerase